MALRQNIERKHPMKRATIASGGDEILLIIIFSGFDVFVKGRFTTEVSNLLPQRCHLRRALHLFQVLPEIPATASVFLSADGEWQPSVSRPIQPISSVILDDRVKERLLEHVGSFLDPASGGPRRSLPRRCYFFHGPTGTGKTCLALAIAGHFDLHVYIVCLPVSDSNLKPLFARVPARSIIILEDVENANLKQRGGTTSLPALLDAIDSAVGSHLIIMTTRHVELVDSALLEPGRLAMPIGFGLADKEMISGLFRFASDDSEAASSLAEEFAAKIPEREFSPAELMSYFTSNIWSPEAATSGVEEWMATVRYEREKMRDTRHQ